MGEKFSQLHKIIVELMRKFKVPGLAISIFKGGNILYEKGFGARNLEKNLPMTPHTLMGIGSISKSFVAFLILKLQQMELISVEDSVKQYIKIEPFDSNPDIKIKHLLSHSSGIPSVDGQWLPIAITYGDYERIYPLSSEEDYLYHISQTKDEIYFKPGKKFFYNNDMYTVLGLIIENLTNKAYKDILQEEILNPLEMKRATVVRDKLEADQTEDFMKGYIHQAKKEKDKKKNIFKSPPVPFAEYLQAPGGIFASMHEMLNYGECLVNKGIFRGNCLLNDENFKQLWTPQIKSPYGFGSNPQYCFGWVKEDDFHEEKLVHHGGGLGVSTSFFALLPERQIVVSIAENDDSGICRIVGESALEILLGKDPEIVNKELRLLMISDQLLGKYESSLGLYELIVNMKGLNLEVRLESDDGSFNFPLIIKDLEHLEFYLFSTIPNSKQILKFHKDRNNKIKFVTYDRYLYHKI